jgi:uncharacterized protein (TIRG00374 family)
MLDIESLVEGLSLITGSNVTFIILALIVNTIAAVLISWKYSVIVSYINEKLPLWESLKVQCVTQFSSFILPFKVASFVTKPVMGKYYSSMPVKKGVLATAIEQLHELSLQIVLVSILLLMIGRGFALDSIIAAVLLCALAIFALKRKWFMERLFGAGKLLPGMIRNKLKKAVTGKKEVNDLLEKTVSAVKNPLLLLKITLLFLALVFVLPLTAQFVVMFFGLKISYSEAFLIYWIPQIIGKLSNIPGGYGVRDTSMAGLLYLLCGIDLVTAVQITLLHRAVIMLVPYVIIGAPGFLYAGGKMAYKRGIHGKD